MQAFINTQNTDLQVANEIIRALNSGKKLSHKVIVETNYTHDESPREPKRASDERLAECQERLDDANIKIKTLSFEA